MNAYTRCPAECVAKETGKLIDTKWIDINKGDASNPNYRSRLVSREFNQYKDDMVYASTPPLEAMRVLLSDAATVDNFEHEEKNMRRDIMINDVSRAYFYAQASRALFIKLPQEDEDAQQGQVGRLNVCLYGTRDAAKGWQQTLTKHLLDIGYVRGRGHRQYLITLLAELRCWSTGTTTCQQEVAPSWTGWRSS